MPRYLVTLSYDGTAYQGWQVQPNQPTLQATITAVISRIINQPELVIYASGRTDAGVHAHGQTFHFDSDKVLDIDQFRYAANSLLPEDIHFNTIRIVADDFHARLSAKAKKYRYILNMGENNPFSYRTIYQLKRYLNVEKMQAVATLFQGSHNFQSFTSKEEDFLGYIRTIYKLEITSDGTLVYFDFTGEGFMRYQIRMIVGTLIEVGLERRTSADVTQLLESPSHPPVSSKAPAQGLYLIEVLYE